jgi:hypothetical protein
MAARCGLAFAEEGAAGVEVEEGDLEEDPGAKEELLRCLPGHGRWRGGVAAAARCSAPSRGRAERLGFGRGATGRGWGKRGRMGAFKGAPGISGRSCGRGSPAVSPVISGALVRGRWVWQAGPG